MNSENKRSRNVGFFAGLCAFSLIWILLLIPSLTSSESLFAGDAPGLMPAEHPGFLAHHFYGSWHYNNGGLGEGVGATSWNPLRWLRDLVTFSPKHQEMTYFIASLLTFLGMLYYLGGLFIPMAQRLAPALAYTFAGYSFGLIAGGHNGFFQMTAYVIWLFAVLHRAVERGSWLHYAWAGTLLIWGISVQPDMMIPLSIVAVFYGLTLLIGKWKRSEMRKQLIVHTAIGLAITTLFFGIFGIGAFRFLFETVIPTRDREAGQTEAQRWAFMTNWSMPVSETPEFIIPNLYGVDSETPGTPYWGALGRPMDWEKNIGILQHNLTVVEEAQRPRIQQQLQQYRRSVNLRQHSMYIGVVPVVLGLFALGLSLFGRESEWVWSPGIRWRRLVWFWMGVGFVGLIFCYGRNLMDGTLYRIPYNIPYLGKIRAPVKYVRLLEIGLAFTSAIGLALAMARLKRLNSPVELKQDTSNAASRPVKGKKKKKKKKARKSVAKQPPSTGGTKNKAFFWGFVLCAIVSTVLLIALISSQMDTAGFTRKLQKLGFGSKVSELKTQMFLAILQSSVLFGALTAFFALCWRKPSLKVLGWAPWILVALVATDVYLVNFRLIRTRDKAAWHAENPVAEIITSTPGRWQTDNLAIPFNRLNPISFNWVYNGVNNLRPSSQQQVKEDTQEFISTFKSNQKRLWDITGTRFVIAPRAQVSKLTAIPDVSEISGIDLDQGSRTWKKADSGSGPLALLENESARPYATLHYQWKTSIGTNTLNQMADASWDMDRELLVEPASPPIPEPTGNRPVTPVDLESLKHHPTLVELRVQTDEPAMLLVQEKYHPDVEVQVNGKSAQLHRCNGILRGVYLPTGESTVVFTYRPYLIPLMLSLLTTVALVAWSIGSIFVRRRSKIGTDGSVAEA